MRRVMPTMKSKAKTCSLPFLAIGAAVIEYASAVRI